MIEGNDGGANVTFNGGRSWSSIQNQPTAQFYRVVDGRPLPVPRLRRAAGQHDGRDPEPHARRRHRPLRLAPGGRLRERLDRAEAGRPRRLLRGLLRRRDRPATTTGRARAATSSRGRSSRSGRRRRTSSTASSGTRPSSSRPHAPHALYHAAQVAPEEHGRRARRGQEISPDLTRNEKATQGSSGGPITFDNTGVEVYGVVFALVESPHEAGTIWAGTDDGLVQLTRDGGKNWANVTPKGLPERIQINSIEVSPHDAAQRLDRGDDVQARRRPALPLPTCGLRKDVDEDRRAGSPTAPSRASCARIPCGGDSSSRGPSAASTSRSTTARAWQPFQRNLPVVPDHGPHDQGRRPRRRDAGPRVLDPRRPLAARGSGSRSVEKEAVHVFKPAPRRALRLRAAAARAARRAASGRTRRPARSSTSG